MRTSNLQKDNHHPLELGTRDIIENPHGFPELESLYNSFYRDLLQKIYLDNKPIYIFKESNKYFLEISISPTDISIGKYQIIHSAGVKSLMGEKFKTIQVQIDAYVIKKSSLDDTQDFETVLNFSLDSESNISLEPTVHLHQLNGSQYREIFNN